jgi:hypothetical protein
MESGVAVTFHLGKLFLSELESRDAERFAEEEGPPRYRRGPHSSAAAILAGAGIAAAAALAGVAGAGGFGFDHFRHGLSPVLALRRITY